MFFVLQRLFRRLRIHPSQGARLAVLSLAVCGYGAAGFLYFEKPNHPELTWWDAIWYSLVTVTTVGYGDYAPSTLGGRYLVALPLMLLGIGLLGYILSLSASKLVESKSRAIRGLGAYKGERHLLIFNFPSLEKVTRVLDELRADSKFSQLIRGVVLVDEELLELPPELEDRGVSFIKGPPARDETLRRASADSASHALILSQAAGDPRTDARNLTITLALEARAPSVHSIVECADPETEELLRKAGCDGIACSARFDAHLLSQELLDPGAGEVVSELLSNLSGQQVYITDLPANLGSYPAVQERCKALGHLCIGLRCGKRFELNPAHGFDLAQADAVVTIGPARLERL